MPSRRELNYSSLLNASRKTKEKTQWTCKWEKMSKAIEENHDKKTFMWTQFTMEFIWQWW